MNALINLFLFYLFYFLFFLCTIGYGKVFYYYLKFQKKDNYFDLIFFGIIFYLIIANFLYFTIGINFYTNIVILIFGIFYFFYKKSDFNIPKIYSVIIFLLIFFSGLLISKTHEDFPLYHFFSIQELFDSKLTIGLPVINFRFVHASLLSFSQSLFVLPFFDYKLIHLPIFFIYIATVGYFLYQNYFSKNSLEKFFSLSVVIMALIKFSRLSEFGYDIPSQFLLLVVFHKIYFMSDKQNEIIKSFILFFFSIIIKPVSLFFLPIFVGLLLKQKLYKIIMFLKQKSFLIILIILFFITLSNSFIRTACLFYPVNQTCFSKEKIFWSQKEDLRVYKEVVSDWAKGYYHQEKSRYKKIESKQEYNKNFNWLKYWVNIHFFYKISEYLLICFSVFLILYFLSKKNKNLFYPDHHKLVLTISIISILFWLFYVPQFRFGFSSILIFVFFLFLVFCKKIKNFQKKNIFIFLIFSFLVFNIKNSIRIYNEFNRSDNFQYVNFPWYAHKVQDKNVFNLSIIEYRFIKILTKKLK